MEKHFFVTPPPMSIFDPVPDSKELVAVAMHHEMRNLYPGTFIEKGTEYLKDLHREYDEATLVFALYRHVTPEEIRRQPKSLWLINYNNPEQVAYLQTQGVNHYDTFHVKYRYLNDEQILTFIAVKADR